MSALPKVQRRRGRPRKEDACYGETRELLLKAGVSRLTEKGFSATGIDEILKSVDVPKGSFYHYFKSKEAYGLALIDQYARYFDEKLRTILRNQTRTPLQRLRDFVDDAESGMQKHDFKRGCLVGNLGQEMGALPVSFRAQLIGAFHNWEAQISACIKAGQEAGEIRAEIDPAQMAEYFWIGWEGAVLRAKLEQSHRPLRVFSENFFASIQR
ncbi:MAG: TetR/AcrR family transcriptional regulator [Granulosicoccaceae bacterium]